MTGSVRIHAPLVALSPTVQGVLCKLSRSVSGTTCPVHCTPGEASGREERIVRGEEQGVHVPATDFKES
eukprot:767339-Hanusia_phi.AAC.1